MSPVFLDMSGLTDVRRDDTRVFAQRMLQDVEQMLRLRRGGLGWRVSSRNIGIEVYEKKGP
jgi:hypothetical protein